MKLKQVLRIVSLAMLIIAIVFLSYVFTHPEAGTVFYIGSLEIGSAIWRVFYLIYAIVMLALFDISFFRKSKK